MFLSLEISRDEALRLAGRELSLNEVVDIGHRAMVMLKGDGYVLLGSRMNVDDIHAIAVALEAA